MTRISNIEWYTMYTEIFKGELLLTSARWHQLGPPIFMLHQNFQLIFIWVRQLSFSLGNFTKGHSD